MKSMAIKKEDMHNSIKLEGILLGYSIKKDDKATRMYSREGQFKEGDIYTRYSGFIDVLTNVETGNYVRVGIDTEPKTYKSGTRMGEPTELSLLVESMSKKEIDGYNKTRSVANTPTVSVWGREPYHFKFDDNFYFKDGVLVETIKTDLGFANLTVGNPVEEPRFKNEFVVYGYVSSIKDEMDNKNMPTDRVVVEAYVPYTTGYGENEKVLAFNMPLIGGKCVDELGEYDIAQLILEEENGMGVTGYSWKLVGSIHSWSDVEEVETDDRPRRGGGRQVKETKQGRHNTELLLEGYHVLGNDGELFSEEDIEQAIKARQIAIETKRKKAEDKKANGGNATKGRAIGGRGGNSESTLGRGATSTATASTTTAPTARGRRSW